MHTALKMSLPSLNNVIVLGGSLSGLMHALVILEDSPKTKVTILERSPSSLLHNQGAGVVAGAETQAFFDQYVRPGRDIAVTSQQRLYLHRNGGIVDGSLDERQQRMTSWDLLYRFLRWRVDGMDIGDYLSSTSSNGTLQDGVIQNSGSKASYQFGCTATNLEDLGESKGVRVTWSDRSQATQSEVADLVITSDGASSSIRSRLRPDVERRYAGYVAFRGTVSETELSSETVSVMSEEFAFFHQSGIQILSYLIPGDNGSIKPGTRLMNWVWYTNYPDGSPELEELMTDAHGKRHPITLPVSKMKPSVWKKQKAYAREVLPPQYAELVQKTTHPFVQAITDNICDECVFMDGMVLMVGDALAGFRPHTAASTSQGAFDALTLGRLLRKEIDLQEYRQEVLDFASRVQKHGVVLGERSQFGRHPFAS